MGDDLESFFSRKWMIFDFPRKAKGENCQGWDRNCNTVDPNFPQWRKRLRSSP